MSNGPTRLGVAELFGPTLQGEGPQTGRLASFLRLSGCDLACAWCDTPYTWDWKGVNGVAYDPAVERRMETVYDLADQIDALGPRRVVVTGGEPLLQAKGLAVLAEILRARGIAVDLETNGRHELGPLGGLVSTAVVSPKVGPSAGPQAGKANPVVPTTVAALRDDPTVVWKFVVADTGDLDAVDRFATRYALPAHAVWVMPEGTDPRTILARTPWLADEATGRGWNLSTRLHVLAWGDVRGR